MEKLNSIRSLVSYEGHDVVSIRKSFEDSVDDYLSTCKALNKTPEKSFKGSFNVKTGPDLTGKPISMLRKKKMNLNNVIITALQMYLSKDKFSVCISYHSPRRKHPYHQRIATKITVYLTLY